MTVDTRPPETPGRSLRDQGWLTSVETAEVLGTNRKYVDQLGARGALAIHYIGPVRFYRKEDVEAYRDSHPRLGSKLGGKPTDDTDG